MVSPQVIGSGSVHLDSLAEVAHGKFFLLPGKIGVSEVAISGLVFRVLLDGLAESIAGACLLTFFSARHNPARCRR